MRDTNNVKTKGFSIIFNVLVSLVLAFVIFITFNLLK